MNKSIALIPILLLILACQDPGTLKESPSDIDNGNGTNAQVTSDPNAGVVSNASVSEELGVNQTGEIESTAINESEANNTKGSVAMESTQKTKEPSVGVRLTNIPNDWEERGARAGEYCAREYKDFEGVWDDLSVEKQKFLLKCIEINCVPLCKGKLVNKCEMQCQYSGKTYVKQFLRV